MDLPYYFIFDHDECYFHDKVGQKIGCVKADGGLLYFEYGKNLYLSAYGCEADGGLL